MLILGLFFAFIFYFKHALVGAVILILGETRIPFELSVVLRKLFM